ncbi:MAG TPA: aldo/keto reductase [Rhizorhapis sp.]|nr:aldo/keto reductase [Rhizorhapis sp.]
MSLPQRTLGPFTVPAIGFGCMNLSHAYGGFPDEESAIALLNRALDLGCTFLDTAALYGDGKNERLLAKAVMHRRGEFVLASKCVLDYRDGKRVLDGRPETIRQTLDEALIRLKTDVIDLYYLHRLDRNVPIEDSVGALAEAVQQGKIRTIGLSEMSAATIRRAHAVHPVTALQSEYSPCVRNIEIAAVGACRELGIGIVPFSPVARGMLAGAIRNDGYAEGDIRRQFPRFIEPQLSHNLKAVAKFNVLAAEIGCTPAQLSLAWILSKGEDMIPIPGTRDIAHLEENLGAVNVRLEPATIARVEAIFTPEAIRGGRYNAPMQAQIDTEILPYEVAE